MLEGSQLQIIIKRWHDESTAEWKSTIWINRQTRLADLSVWYRSNKYVIDRVLTVSIVLATRLGPRGKEQFYMVAVQVLDQVYVSRQGEAGKKTMQ